MNVKTISLPCVRQLGLPICWQEAVAIAHAASRYAERHNVRLTLHGCVLGVDGTVMVVPGTEQSGKTVSELQLAESLLGTRPAPLQLQHLLATADGALNIFPSERNPEGAPLTLASFVQPNAPQQIARLARRALAASSGNDESEAEPQRPVAIDLAAGAAAAAQSSATPPAGSAFRIDAPAWRGAIALGVLLLLLVLGWARGGANVAGAATAVAGVVEETAAAVGLSPAPPARPSTAHP